MLLQASQLIGAEVKIYDQSTRLGWVEQLIFDPLTGTVVAFRVRTSGFLAKSFLLAPLDIFVTRAHQLEIREADCLLSLSELPRVQAILQQKIPVLGQRAQTESGKNLGSVADVLIEVTSWKIVKYYLQGIVKQQILPATLIVNLSKRAVVFSDRVFDPPPTVVAVAETEVAIS